MPIDIYETKTCYGDENYNELLANFCQASAQWRPYVPTHIFLVLIDLPSLNLEAKAWSIFFHHNMESCSNYLEVIVKRALKVFALMKRRPINLGQIILDKIFKLENDDKAVMRHASIIHMFVCHKGLRVTIMMVNLLLEIYDHEMVW